MGWEISVGVFCILEPLKNGGCQQLLNWRLLQKPCYWLFCILHVHHATKHSLNYVLYLSLLVGTFIFNSCEINEIIKSEFWKYLLQVWNSLMNVPLKLWKRRKTIYIFFLKGGFNKLERSTILSLILKLSLSTKLWINEYVSCGFPRA